MALINTVFAANISGEILKSIVYDSDYYIAGDVIANQPANTTIYTANVSDTGDTIYAFGGNIIARPLFTSVGSWNTLSITANGVSTASFISSLPNPTQVSIVLPSGLGSSHSGTSVTTGTFNLTTTVAGSYVVTFTAFPYQTLTTTITAI